jgi:hypothetical protein
MALEVGEGCLIIFNELQKRLQIRHTVELWCSAEEAIGRQVLCCRQEKVFRLRFHLLQLIVLFDQ